MLTLDEYRKNPTFTNDKEVVIASNHGLTLRGKNQFIEIRLYPDLKSNIFNFYFERCLTPSNTKSIERAIKFIEKETIPGFVNIDEAEMVIVDIDPETNLNPLFNKILLIRKDKDVTSLRFKMV